MASGTLYKDRRNGLWNKCAACKGLIFRQTLERNLYICPQCNYYSPMPAAVRLDHLFDSDSAATFRPLATDKESLKALELSDFVSQDLLVNRGQWLIATGEGKISGYSAIVVAVEPYALPQRSHFVTLLVALRTALRNKIPLITIYPSNTLPKRKSDQLDLLELSPLEITYLTVEMDFLSQACLPQITVLTDADSITGFSTKFPPGDLVVAEKCRTAQNRFEKLTDSSHGAFQPRRPQPDIIIDHYVQRQDLPVLLGKLLAFFNKT